jgi:hypothetical protein
MKFFRDLTKEDFKELMAYTSMWLSFIYIFGVTFVEIPKENQRFADIILGSLLSMVIGGIISHYFNDGEGKKEDGVSK